MLMGDFRASRSGLFVVLMMVLIACGNTGGGAPEQPATDQGSADPQTEPAEGAEQQAGEADSVTFSLSYLPVPDSTIAWYSALDKGRFAEENLDVEIVRGFGSGDTVQRVAVGEADFGLADPSALVPMRVNEDVPVIAVASIYAESPYSVIFRRGEGIEEPTDLEGRSIASFPGSAIMLVFPAFAAATGIDADAVEWKLSDPGSELAGFASGQTDATANFVTDLPRLEHMLEDEDVELDFFSYAEHGVTNYTQMLIVAERTIEEHPDLVERFVRAAMSGIEFSVDNPDEAVAIFLDYTDNDPDLSQAAWETMLDRGVMANEDTERHGFGYISAERMAATFDTLVGVLDLDPGDYTPEDLYTTDFLP